MYTCVYIYIYMYMYIYMCRYIYIYIYTYAAPRRTMAVRMSVVQAPPSGTG